MSANPFRRVLPNYIFTYLPIVVVMIVNPILYWKTSERVINNSNFILDKSYLYKIQYFKCHTLLVIISGTTINCFNIGKVYN